MPLGGIPSRGRATQGVYLMRFKADDKVASISVIDKVETEEGVEGEFEEEGVEEEAIQLEV